jgi:hypothetical protein
MNISLGELGYVRKYLFTYVKGVLWLMFGAVALEGFRPIELFAGVIARAGGQLTSETAVLVLVVFALALGGILVPYCIGIVLNPIAVTLLDLGMKVGKRFVSAERMADRKELYNRALDAVAVDLGAKLRCHHNDLILIVELKSPREAAILLSMEENVYFRGTATIPSALLLGGFIGNYFGFSSVGWFAAAGASVLLLALGIYHANYSLLSLSDRVYMAVLVLSKKGP